MAFQEWNLRRVPGRGELTNQIGSVVVVTSFRWYWCICIMLKSPKLLWPTSGLGTTRHDTRITSLLDTFFFHICNGVWWSGEDSWGLMLIIQYFVALELLNADLSLSLSPFLACRSFCNQEPRAGGFRKDAAALSCSKSIHQCKKNWPQARK